MFLLKYYRDGYLHKVKLFIFNSRDFKIHFIILSIPITDSTVVFNAVLTRFAPVIK